ncbi:MAG TPA: hypothetical protein PKD26_04835 [Pyrinomonadaceae bacterium]|nr:hypothetical protein [Pyrinomonadaceae bacterium]
MKRTTTILSIAAVIALGTLVSAAQAPEATPNSRSGESKADAPSKQVLKRSGDGTLEFPEIDGWVKGTLVKYPQKELGYGLNYDAERGNRVSIYVYNGGRKDIGKSLEGVVKDEIERAKAEIDMVAEMGAYTDVKVIKDERTMLGGKAGKIETLRKILSFKSRGVELHSEIIIFPFEGNFVKLRATRPVSLGTTGEEAVARLMTEIEKFFLMYMDISDATKTASVFH